MSVELIPVSKDGHYLEVHPTTLAAHKAIGWSECAKQEAPEDGEGSASAGLKVGELREALAAKGIEIPEGAKNADLQKLLDEAA